MLTDADGTHRTILPTQPSKEELAP
jgi:hypothetical protein